MALSPKILLINDQPTSSPFEAFHSKQQRWHLALERRPTRAFQRWMEETPDLVIFDIGEASALALKLVRDLRQQAVIPILLLGSNSAVEYMLEAYEAGVDEYILRPIHPSLLQAKVRAWLRRSWSVPVDMLDSLKVGNVHLIPTERVIVFNDRAPIRLTNLELRLMFYLMSHAGRTATAEEVCRRVWGSYVEGNKTTLKNVVYRLRQKLEADPAHPHCIQTVAGMGYQFRME
jgi:DNA-binding response OmpR family regulator